MNTQGHGRSCDGSGRHHAGSFSPCTTSNSLFSTGSIVRCMAYHDSVEDRDERPELQNLLPEAAFFFAGSSNLRAEQLNRRVKGMGRYGPSSSRSILGHGRNGDRRHLSVFPSRGCRSGPCWGIGGHRGVETGGVSRHVLRLGPWDGKTISHRARVGRGAGGSERAELAAAGWGCSGASIPGAVYNARAWAPDEVGRAPELAREGENKGKKW
jgi:hypothetical protein